MRITPFENAQRWMGKNTFPILLLNDDNIIGEHQETRMKMPNMCPFEKKEKYFFQTNNFFFAAFGKIDKNATTTKMVERKKKLLLQQLEI